MLSSPLFSSPLLSLQFWSVSVFSLTSVWFPAFFFFLREFDIFLYCNFVFLEIPLTCVYIYIYIFFFSSSYILSLIDPSADIFSCLQCAIVSYVWRSVSTLILFKRHNPSGFYSLTHTFPFPRVPCPWEAKVQVVPSCCLFSFVLVDPNTIFPLLSFKRF